MKYYITKNGDDYGITKVAIKDVQEFEAHHSFVAKADSFIGIMIQFQHLKKGGAK